MYETLPRIIQVRRNCIISYDDSKYLPTTQKKNTNTKKKTHTNEFTPSAKKRMKKMLDVWTYSMDNTTTTAFITLTLSSKWLKKENYEGYVKKFIQTIKYKVGGFNHVWKSELQKNGNIHYHILTDKIIDWRIVRAVWNRIQKIHVDCYQIKMKEKYKNGYYFDTKLTNQKNEIIDEETQKKRYLYGKKCNWRNPNSTDIKIVDDVEQLGAYINKYLTKDVEENNEITEKNTPIKRYWGKNQELEKLKFTTIKESELSNNTITEIINNQIKKIVVENTEICIVHSKIKNQELEDKEQEQLKINREILNIQHQKNRENTKNINKEIKKYNTLFNY